MFAASITAKKRGAFLPLLLQMDFTTPKMLIRSFGLKRKKTDKKKGATIADHESCLDISGEYVNVTIKWPDPAAATTKKQSLGPQL